MRPALSDGQVQALSWSERLWEGLVRGLSKTRPATIRRMLAVLQPDTAWALLLLLGLWASAHFYGAGELADIAVTTYGLYQLGSSVFQAGSDLYHYARRSLSAKTDKDLDEAGDFLAAGLSEGLVTAFETLVASRTFNLARRAMLKVRPVPATMKARIPRLANELARRINERVGSRLTGEDLKRGSAEDLQSRPPEDLQSLPPEETSRRSDRERTPEEEGTGERTTEEPAGERAREERATDERAKRERERRAQEERERERRAQEERERERGEPKERERERGEPKEREREGRRYGNPTPKGGLNWMLLLVLLGVGGLLAGRSASAPRPGGSS